MAMYEAKYSRVRENNTKTLKSIKTITNSFTPDYPFLSVYNIDRCMIPMQASMFTVNYFDQDVAQENIMKEIE